MGGCVCDGDGLSVCFHQGQKALSYVSDLTMGKRITSTIKGMEGALHFLHFLPLFFSFNK